MKTIALIGGTGLDDWGECEEQFSVETPYGEPSDSIRQYRVGPVRLLFLPRHGAGHAIAPHCVNYRANLYALKELGAAIVIAVNAVGGISLAFPPGALALPDQLIDYTWGRQHTFSDGPQRPLQHVEFAEPFSGVLRDGLLGAAHAAGIPVETRACLGVMQGPRLESAAEIQRLAKDGCDLVGMTTMPEAGLARELDIPYASICVVANWAAGVSSEPITMAGIEQTLAEAMVSVRSLVSRYLAEADL